MAKQLFLFTRVKVVTNLYTTCNKSVHKLLSNCVRSAGSKLFNLNKFGTSCQQLVTSLIRLSDSLQGCSNKTDTVMISKYCYILVSSTLRQSCYNRSVSELIGQPCKKSDVLVKLVPSCQQAFPNMSTTWEKQG